MAKTLGNLVVRVGIDGRNFDKGIKNLNAQMALARSEMRASTSQFSRYGRGVDVLRAKQQGLANQYRIQGARVQELRNRYNQLIKTHGAESEAAMRAGARLNNATAEYNRMGRQLQGLTKELRYQESGWYKASTSLKTFSDRTGRLGDSMRSTGRSMTVGLTLPIAGVATAAIRTGMDFDKSMSKVQAISGATGSEFDALRNQARKLGRTTQFSATDAANGMEFLARAGWNTKEIMAGMPGMLDLAAAGALDLGRAADITSNIMSAFSIEASKSGKVADVLAYAAANANTDVEQLGEAMTYIAPVANTMGWSLEESTAAVMAMSDAGIQGQKAGAAFSTSLQRLSKPTKEAKTAMKALNVEFFDQEGAMKPLPAIIKELEKGTKGMTKEQKAAHLTTIFGAEAYKHWAVLIDKGSDSLYENTEALKHSDGAASEMAETMRKNFAGAVEELRSKLADAGIIISDKLTPAIQTLSKWIGKATDKFASMDSRTQNMILVSAGLAAAIGPVVIGMGLFFKSLSIVTGGLSKGIGMFGRYRTSMTTTNRTMNTIGNTATVTSRKINASNVAIGNAGKGMSGLRLSTTLAGGAMAMFGGDVGMVTGVLTMFLPELFEVGKGLFGFGEKSAGAGGKVGGLGEKVTGTGKRFSGFAAKATETGGKVAGFGTKALNVTKNVGGLSRILGVARGAFGSLGGPIGMLATIALPELVKGGFNLYKHLKEESIPATYEFGDEVSKATTKAVKGYMKLNDEATTQLNELHWSGTKITKETSAQLTGTFDKMGNQIKTRLKEDFDQSYNSLNSFLKNSKGISAKEQQEILNNVKNKNEEQKKSVSDSQARIKEILETARKEKRALTDAERREINKIQDNMAKTAVKTMSKSEVEQKTIMERLKKDSKNITARQAADTVKNSVKAKKGAVKEANDKYDKTVAAIIRERDETGSISNDQADKLIKEAKRQRDESVEKAESMHKGVVKQAKKQAKGQIDNIDWASGEVLTNWDKMVRGTAKGVNMVSKGINWVLRKIGMKKHEIPMWKPKGYATGTSRQGHPGGPAIVGEKGRELAYIPGAGVTMLGQKGPELHPNLPRGTAVLPNRETEKTLKSYGFPGYAKGIGDFFSLAFKGPKKLMKKVWEKFDPKIEGVGGTLKTMGKGIISFLKKKSTSFIGEKLKDFLSFSSFTGGKASGNVNKWIRAAVGITGVPSSWIGPLTTIAMKESGGNPRAINLWDINAKRGIPSKGLMQTIDPTFNAYRKKGLDDIWNPIHNAVAAIRYIQRRYGTVFNTPGIKSMMKGGPYRGYAQGGIIDRPQYAMLGENRHREYVITTEPRYRKRSLELWSKLGQELGVLLPDVKGLSGVPSTKTASPRKEKKGDYIINQHIVINSPDPTSPSENARKIKQASRQLAMEAGW